MSSYKDELEGFGYQIQVGSGAEPIVAQRCAGFGAELKPASLLRQAVLPQSTEL